MEAEMRKPDMSLEDAGMLPSTMGNLQLRQVADPKRTVRIEMKKTVLKKLFKYRLHILAFNIGLRFELPRDLGVFCLGPFAALNSCLLLRRVYEERAIADTT